MAKHIMFTAKSAALRAFVRGQRSFSIFGITLTIEHAHSNQYRVLLPDSDEIFRLVAHHNGAISLYEV